MLVNVIITLKYNGLLIEMNTSKAFYKKGLFSFWKKHDLLRENLVTKNDLAEMDFHNK